MLSPLSRTVVSSEASRRPADTAPHAPRFVAIGGGTGLPTVLDGLRQAAGVLTSDDRTDWLTAVVTVMDDGGSSGRLRESLGMLPPGDIRNCLAALVRTPSTLSSVLHHRLPSHNGLAGHAIGNLLLAALTSTEGDFTGAVRALGAQMDICGRVLPATLESVHLKARFDDGTEVLGETAITARRGRIRQLMLERAVSPAPEVIEAIAAADLIVVGPGSLYTSLLPNLLVNGVAHGISRSAATTVYVANLMTQPGETDGYTLGDHLRALREHTGLDLFDYVLVNRAPIPAAAVADYAADGARLVGRRDEAPYTDRARIVTADLVTVTSSGEIRHDPSALGFALVALAASCRRVGLAPNDQAVSSFRRRANRTPANPRPSSVTRFDEDRVENPQ